METKPQGGSVQLLHISPLFKKGTKKTGPSAEQIEEVRRGLSGIPKTLPPKFLYDERGTELFVEITRQPEYYPTRTETGLLEEHADELVRIASPEQIIEIGAGASRKNVLLLEAMYRATGGHEYAPIDVSEDALRTTARHLQDQLPWLDFRGYVGDFGSDLLRIPRTGRRLVAFLGSTIGNMEQPERLSLLRSIREMLEGNECLLLGFDLVKNRATLEAAYDDAAGVSAAFNLNVLEVLNRELKGDLPVDAFRHHAPYVREKERVEMRLVAQRPVRARLEVADLDVHFEEGEYFLTEVSTKFRRAGLERELGLAGLAVEHWIEHPGGVFGLALIRRA